MIGIVGGMGPLAGIDLAQKIINQTLATKDQDHISQILYSSPKHIGDRTEYVLGNIKENPAYAIANIIFSLESMGATVVGLPCNSAHAPEIFSVIKQSLEEKKASIQLLHMIEEVGKFIKTYFPNLKRVGVLGTTGTYKSGLYNRIKDFDVINVSEKEVEAVHQAVYHPEFGIKSVPDKISEQSMGILNAASRSLIEKGAEVIVLGCTELPLALTGKYFENTPLVDSTLVLARALIASVDPGKLKSW